MISISRTKTLLYAVGLFTLLIGVAGVGAITSSRNASAVDDNWYVGEGAQPNTYVTYRIQDIDTNNGQAFDMTIYFQKQDDNGDWIAPVYVIDQGNVFNGTLMLGSLDLSVLGSGSNIPDNLSPYVDAYKDSLQWLSAYVPKPGQSLNAASWGKIASIGGSEIKPSGTEKITVKGGTFDTTKIVYHKSVDSIIWIENEFPYPIRAQTYADVTTGNPPVQYAFELLKTGSGQPPAPTTTVEIPKPPLEQRTGRGTYYIDLNWTPAEIRPGEDVSFQLSFFDNNHIPVQNVNYDFAISTSNGNVVKEMTDQFTGSSSATQLISFGENNTGPMTVDVKINGVGSVDPGAFIESAQFNIVAVPEFSGGIIFLGAAGLIGVVFILVRFGKIGLSKIGNL